MTKTLDLFGGAMINPDEYIDKALAIHSLTSIDHKEYHTDGYHRIFTDKQFLKEHGYCVCVRVEFSGLELLQNSSSEYTLTSLLDDKINIAIANFKYGQKNA